MCNAAKNVVQYGTAFDPSEYGQITWDFQTGRLSAWKSWYQDLVNLN